MVLNYKNKKFYTPSLLEKCIYVFDYLKEIHLSGYLTNVWFKNDKAQAKLGKNDDRLEDAIKTFIDLDIFAVSRNEKCKHSLDENKNDVFNWYQREIYIDKRKLVIVYLLCITIENLSNREIKYLHKKHFSLKLEDYYSNIDRRNIHEVTYFRSIIKKLLAVTLDYFQITDLKSSIFKGYGVHHRVDIPIPRISNKIEPKYVSNSRDSIVVTDCSYPYIQDSSLSHSVSFCMSNYYREKCALSYPIPPLSLLIDRKISYRNDSEYKITELIKKKINPKYEPLFKSYDYNSMNPLEIKCKGLDIDETELKYSFAIFVVQKNPLLQFIRNYILLLTGLSKRNYINVPDIRINVKTKRVESKNIIRIWVSGRQHNTFCETPKEPDDEDDSPNIRVELLKARGFKKVNSFDLHGAIFAAIKSINTGFSDVDYDIKTVLCSKGFTSANGKILNDEDDFKPLLVRVCFESNAKIAFVHFRHECGYDPWVTEETFYEIYRVCEEEVAGFEGYRFIAFFLESLLELIIQFRIATYLPSIRFNNVYDCFYFDESQATEEEIKDIINNAFLEFKAIMRTLLCSSSEEHIKMMQADSAAHLLEQMYETDNKEIPLKIEFIRKYVKASTGFLVSSFKKK